MSESPHADARRLGSAYVLDSRIGSGAQGEVWCAHRVSAPGEPLAVKLLRTDLADDEQVLDRFLKERATLMRVSSPYVVGVQDMVVEGATFAIVMTYVGGGDLRALLRTTGPLMPADTARVGALLARGLEAVHVAGIVHRDVKPANVLIEWGPGGAAPGGRETAPAGATQVVGIDARFTPRLADFGVARLTQTVGSSHTTAAVGTPLYMAPEVLDPHPPTPAADIYSLGVVLYEMSCGVPPFTGSPGQVLAQHARRDPGRPDGLPEPLWALLTAMLAKDPAARPTAAAVAQALEVMTTTLTGLPAAAALQAPPPSTPTARPHEWGTGPTALAGPVLPSSPSAGGASRTRDAGPVYGLMGAAGTGPTLREAAAPTVPGRLAAPDRPAVPAPAYGLTPPPPRRRRLLVLPALAIVLALAAGTWWWTHRPPTGTGLTALPVPGRPSQIQALADVDDLLVGPGGTALATEHGAGTWRLHDLSRSDEAPVWQGTCSAATFWDAEHLLCERRDGGGDSLIALDGSRLPVPGPEKRRVLGATETTAVVVDGGYRGALVGLGASGTERWRAYGSYEGGRVENGFVTAWEGDKEEVVVLDAATGTVLLSRPLAAEPDWDEPLPGGVGTDVGPGTFYTHETGTWTVHEADGSLAGEVSTALERTGWTASGDLSATDLLDLLSSAPTEPGAVTVRGAERTVTAVADTASCTLAVDGRALDLPAQTEGCLLTPLGLVGGDGALLVQTGASEVFDAPQVRALSLSDGTASWHLNGTLVAVLPASPRAGGGRDFLPVMLTEIPDGYRTDALLLIVEKD